MKTTKLKEWLIKISRDKRTSKITFWIEIACMIMIIISAFLTVLSKILFVRHFAWTLLIASFCFTAMLAALEARDEKTIRNNKLINIMMSNRAFVIECIIWIYIPLQSIIFYYLKIKFFYAIIISILAFICFVKATKIINQYFENKLSK